MNLLKGKMNLDIHSQFQVSFIVQIVFLLQLYSINGSGSIRETLIETVL